MRPTPAKASGTTTSVTTGTATRLTGTLSGCAKPMSDTVAGMNTSAMASWAETADPTRERLPRRGAKNPTSTATAPKESQNPVASGAIGATTSTTASA